MGQGKPVYPAFMGYLVNCVQHRAHRDAESSGQDLFREDGGAAGTIGWSEGSSIGSRQVSFVFAVAEGGERGTWRPSCVSGMLKAEGEGGGVAVRGR